MFESIYDEDLKANSKQVTAYTTEWQKRKAKELGADNLHIMKHLSYLGQFIMLNVDELEEIAHNPAFRIRLRSFLSRLKPALKKLEDMNDAAMEHNGSAK